MAQYGCTDVCTQCKCNTVRDVRMNEVRIETSKRIMTVT